MAYQDESNGYRSTAKAIGVIMPALILVYLVKPLALPLLKSWFTEQSMKTERGAEAALLDDPVLRPVIATVKQRFPDDYRPILKAFSDAMAVDKSTAGKMLFDRIGMIEQRDAHFLNRAPAPALRAMAAADLALLQRLEQTSPAACVEMGETGHTKQPLSPETGALLLDTRVRTLNAIADGRDTPVPARPHDPKALAMAAAQLEATIPAALHTSQAREILFGKRTLDQALPVHRCEVQVAIRMALTSIPPESADLLIAASAANP